MAQTEAWAGSDLAAVGGAFQPTDYVRLFFELFEFSSDAVWITRLEDGYVYEANGAFLSLFGLSRRRVIGRSTVDLGLWARPHDRDAIVRKLRESGRIERYHVRLRKTWSEEFTMSLSEVMVPWRGEQVILAVGTVLH
jgi:PAS domain S-box-containing protein